MSSGFATLEALANLTTAIPQWNTRLNDLNGQISLRQIELARLTDQPRPQTHSLKHKGSTESLLLNDGGNNAILPDNGVPKDDVNQFDSPKSEQNGFVSKQRPSSPAAAQTAAAVLKSTPPRKVNAVSSSNARSLTRQSSQPAPSTQARLGPSILRKRKTDSLASGESFAPKYRTRSMIIVYYDSAVQTAFEDLVKFVSSSRNAMRKGKLAAKMAAMRRVAELEVGDEDEDEDEDEDDDDNDYDNPLMNLSYMRSGGLLQTQKNVIVNKEGKRLTEKEGVKATEEDQLVIPKLRFTSTRQMGLSRDQRLPRAANPISLGMMRGYRSGGAEREPPDIFDELDKGLEWCQSQCEHAAHQFLRDGECSTEIENIKRRLGDVRDMAEKEMERLQSEKACQASKREVKVNMPVEGRARELRSIQVRKGPGPAKDLEVDDMEVDAVDDEAVHDCPPTLIYKKAGDFGR